MQTYPIRLYGMRDYDRSAKVRWLLNEMGLPYEDRWLDRQKMEHESPEYLRVNPMGRVPAAVIGDRIMVESAAICAYLADLHPEKGFAPAPGAPDRMEYMQWLFFSAQNFDVFQTRIMVIEDIPPGDYFEKKRSALLSDVDDASSLLERTLSRSNYLVGDRFTNADIGMGYHLYWCRLWPELDEVISKYPGVLAYVERLQARPAAVKAKAFSYEG
jgi:glutathione S-transferase